MIGKITIKTNQNIEQMQSYLRRHIVRFKSKEGRLGGGVSLIRGTWRKLDDPQNFRFEIEESGPGTPWFGKCSLSSTGSDQKSILSIQLLPRRFGLFSLLFATFILGVAVYTIVGIGVKNYQESWVYMAVLVPTIALTGMIFFWVSLLKRFAREVETTILDSFDQEIINSQE